MIRSRSYSRYRRIAAPVASGRTRMETPTAVWNTGPSLDSTTRAMRETNSATVASTPPTARPAQLEPLQSAPGGATSP
jgi:hypothetical protein